MYAYEDIAASYSVVCKVLIQTFFTVLLCTKYCGLHTTLLVYLQGLLDNYLLKDESSPPEAKVFYYKMKGDYYRYKAEVLDEEEKSKVIPLAEAAYKDATDVAETLEPTHSVRLGLALNFSVFYYEIQGDKEKACKLAKDVRLVSCVSCVVMFCMISTEFVCYIGF